MGPYPNLIQSLDTFFSSEKLPFLGILPSCFDTPGAAILLLPIGVLPILDRPP